ncbi:hypothetical protein P4O66_013964 [Electrophorus voltai]|uniref:Uncharacterized protein n=1 Tax=Electrophorus voltai TaxID=2609070 RepID=A0AAD8Z244_9TELE|nr:hypothetical protein P4O66_013964 [Electrophorus voltai]
MKFPQVQTSENPSRSQAVGLRQGTVDLRQGIVGLRQGTVREAGHCGFEARLCGGGRALWGREVGVRFVTPSNQLLLFSDRCSLKDLHLCVSEDAVGMTVMPELDCQLQVLRGVYVPPGGFGGVPQGGAGAFPGEVPNPNPNPNINPNPNPNPHPNPNINLNPNPKEQLGLVTRCSVAAGLRAWLRHSAASPGGPVAVSGSGGSGVVAVPVSDGRPEDRAMPLSGAAGSGGTAVAVSARGSRRPGGAAAPVSGSGRGGAAAVVSGGGSKRPENGVALLSGAAGSGGVAMAVSGVAGRSRGAPTGTDLTKGTRTD